MGLFIENADQVDFANVNDEIAQHQIGAKAYAYDATYGWRTYRYWKVADVGVTVGMCVCYSSTTGSVTADFAGGTSLCMAAGIALGSVTVAYHGWFVAGTGDYALINTDGGVAAAGTALVPHSVNGEVDDMAGTEEDHVFAVSVAADTTVVDTVVAVILHGC